MIRSTAIVLLLLATQAASAGEWEFVGLKDGVSTWSQAVPESKLLGFRGESVVPIPRGRLFRTMMDETKTQDWVDLLAESRVIETQGDRQVLYQRYDMAWPVADRDMVIEKVVRHWPEKGLTTVHIRSVDDPRAPLVEGVVRAEVSKTWFALSDVDGGTRVEVEAFTDPKGMVPTWMVNLVQKTWARNSINALVRCVGGEPPKPATPKAAPKATPTR